MADCAPIGRPGCMHMSTLTAQGPLTSSAYASVCMDATISFTAWVTRDVSESHGNDHVQSEGGARDRQRLRRRRQRLVTINCVHCRMHAQSSSTCSRWRSLLS